MTAVVVTGVGCVSALGDGLGASMAALFAGEVQPASTASVETGLDNPPCVFAVTAPLLAEEDDTATRTSRLGITAADQAVAQAWPQGFDLDPARIGVCMGTTVGSTFNEEPFYRRYLAGKADGDAAIRRFLCNDLSRVVAEHVGAAGPVATVANACASGTDAIGIAKMWLDAGLCDVVVAGGADELARFPFLGFASLKNSSTERCRPFDRDRQGLNLGEGAGAVVLERAPEASARSAVAFATVAGYASAADAHHMTAPHPDGRGLRQALAEGLKRAGIDVAQVGMVNAHGTGTKENDRIEGRVLAELVAPGTPVMSTKGFTGHTLGAAGALEAVLTIGCLLEARTPVNAGFKTADPECVLVPTTEITPIQRPYALSTSLAFGGANSALVLAGGGVNT